MQMLKEKRNCAAYFLPVREREIYGRVHSGVWGVDFITLASDPNVHASGEVPSGVWIEEDTEVEVTCSSITLTVAPGDAQNFREVVAYSECGIRHEAWVPESFLHFRAGERTN